MADSLRSPVRSLAAGLATLLFLWLTLLAGDASAASRPPSPTDGTGAPAGSASPLRLLAPAEGPVRSAERDRERLLASLKDSVARYASPLQLLGTAPYYSSEAALEIVLSQDAVITAAAAQYGVEKAMVQAVLFQEIRFLNLLDEVDRVVEATYTYLRQAEDYSRLPPPQRLLTPPPQQPLLSRLDSSTGLGQIFAATAIQAINWQAGQAVYDGGDWRDLCAVWGRLRGDDSYNIKTAALVLAYKRSILQGEGMSEPSPGDIMQAYNGTGELSLRYRAVVCEYYEAFQRYEKG